MDIFAITVDYFSQLNLEEVEIYSIVAGLICGVIFFLLSSSERPLSTRILLSLLVFVFSVIFFMVAKFLASAIIWYVLYLLLG